MNNLDDLRFSFCKYTVYTPAHKNVVYTLDNIIDRITSDNVTRGYIKAQQVFKDNLKNLTPLKEVRDIVTPKIKELYPSLKGDGLKSAINEGIKKYIKKEVKPYKKDLTKIKTASKFYVFGGYQPKGHTGANCDYNGCVQIDIDFKEQGGDKMALVAKEALSKLPYIILAGISPSGVGVKALVRTTNMDKNNHMNTAKQVAYDISSKAGIDLFYFDNVPVAQPCFDFFDKELFVNKNADVFIYNNEIIINNGNVKQRVKNVSPFKKIINTGVKHDVVFNIRQKNKFASVAYNTAINKCGSRVSTPFLQSYIGTCIMFGIYKNFAIGFLIEKGHAGEFNTTKKYNCIDDLYSRYNSNFGTANIGYAKDIYTAGTTVVKKVIGDIKKEVHRTHLVGDKDNVSNLNLDLSNNSLLQAPTGSGKSYFVGKTLKNKRLLIVPTTTLVEQFAIDYGGTPFYQHARDVTNDCQFIITTYSSLPNLLKKINGCEYTAFIDEAHKFSSDAGYLNVELNGVLDALPVFKNYHFMTATPIFNFAIEALKLNHIKITQDKEIVKTISQLVYSDRAMALAMACRRVVDKGEQFMVLFNNKDEAGQLGKFMTVFNEMELKTTLINADKKNEHSFKEIAIKGELVGWNGFFGTNICTEGLNITVHSAVMNVFIVGQFHGSLYEQVSARFRKAKKLHVVQCINAKKVDGFSNYNLKNDKKGVYKSARKYLSWAKETQQMHGGDKILKLHSLNGNGSFYRVKDGKLVMDLTAMSHMVFENQTTAMNADYDYMCTYLKQYGFKEIDIMYNDDVIDNDTMKIVKKNKTMSTKEFNKKVSGISKMVGNMSVKESTKILNDGFLYENTVDLFGDTVEVKRHITPLEHDVIYKANYINNFMPVVGGDNLSKAVSTLMRVGVKNRSFNTLKDQVLIQQLKTDSTFLNNTNNPVVEILTTIYDTFKVGSEFKNGDSQTFINNLLNTVYKRKELELDLFAFSKTKIMHLLKKYMEIEKVGVMKDGVRSYIYKIVSHNPTKLDINTDRHRIEKNDLVPKPFADKTQKHAVMKLMMGF